MPISEMLNYSRFGSGEPLVILHGLFGSGKNWQSLSRIYAQHFDVFTVDLRNHGESFHHRDMDYDVMADDVCRLLIDLGIHSSRVIGHSMGGKVAMLVALKCPELVSRLVVADIAPVTYVRAFDELIEPILSLPLAQLKTRAAIDEALQIDIPVTQLRHFLLQNLQRDGKSWRWKVNWVAIRNHIDKIIAYPDLPADWQISVPTLFIRGENSDYVGAAEEQVIAEHFSNARISTLERAGHWLHAEQPQRFVQVTREFLLK